MTDLLLWFCVPTTLALALVVDFVVMLGWVQHALEKLAEEW
jgi:hypothetical protein